MLEMLILISAPKTGRVRVDHPAHDLHSSGEKENTALSAHSHTIQLLHRSALRNKADQESILVLGADRDSAGVESP